MLRKPWIYAILAIVVGGCGSLYGLFGYPPEPMRQTEPAGVRTGAVAVGQAAPNFTLKSTRGGDVELAKVVTDERAVILFYRGKW